MRVVGIVIACGPYPSRRLLRWLDLWPYSVGFGLISTIVWYFIWDCFSLRIFVQFSFRVLHTPIKVLCSPTEVMRQVTWHPCLTNPLNSAKDMVRPRPLCNHRPTRTKGSQINSKYYRRYPTNRFLTNRGSLGHRPSTHPKVHRKIIHRSTSHRQAWQATRIFPLNLKWFILNNRCSDGLWYAQSVSTWLVRLICCLKIIDGT